MDREKEAGIVGATGAGLLVVGLIAYFAWRKRNKSSDTNYDTDFNTTQAGKPDGYPTLNNDYEFSDDGLIITSYTNGSTRGWRNHNPGNIVITSDNWVGKIPTSQNTDGKFEQFVANIYGYRAMIKTLQTYIRKGYNTVNKIADRWSGKSNNTTYRNFITSNSILDANEVIAADDYISLMSLVNAMVMMENGKSPEPNEAEIADAAILVASGF